MTSVRYYTFFILLVLLVYSLYSRSVEMASALRMTVTEHIIPSILSLKTFGYVLSKSENTFVQTKFEKVRVVAASRDCRNTTFLNNTAAVSDWMSVNDEKHIFVFSAYHMKNNTIVIIGIRRMPVVKSFCQLWFRNESAGSVFMEEVAAVGAALPESHGKKYVATFYECKYHSTGIPSYVSMVTASCSSPQNLLVVQSTSPPRKYPRTFTVCVSPLYNISDPYTFIEWIELNRIFGADKFTVYNRSAGVSLAKVLQYYSNKGVIEIIPWNIPLLNKNLSEEIHYFGQVAAINDCLYRNKQPSEYIVNVDLDEFIVPHSDKLRTWHDIIGFKKERKPAYLFRNSFFKKEWEVPSNVTNTAGKEMIDKYMLLTPRLLYREKKVFPPRIRSKYIAQTSKVNKLMIHEACGVATENVPTEVALLHHYRYWGGKMGQKPAKKNSVFDDTVPVRYSEDLIQRVRNTWQHL